MELYIERVVSASVLMLGVSMRVLDELWAEWLNRAAAGRFTALWLGPLHLVTGLAIVAGHDVWCWDLPVLTTLVGWNNLLFGVVAMVWPGSIAWLHTDDPEEARTVMSWTGWIAILTGAPMIYGAWIA